MSTVMTTKEANAMVTPLMTKSGQQDFLLAVKLGLASKLSRIQKLKLNIESSIPKYEGGTSIELKKPVSANSVFVELNKLYPKNYLPGRGSGNARNIIDFKHNNSYINIKANFKLNRP